MKSKKIAEMIGDKGKNRNFALTITILLIF